MSTRAVAGLVLGLAIAGRPVEAQRSVLAGAYTREQAHGPIGGGMGGGGMGMISGIVGGALHQPALLPLIVPVWLLVTYATARTTYHSTAQRRARELESLADRIAALAGELIGEQG